MAQYHQSIPHLYEIVVPDQEEEIDEFDKPENHDQKMEVDVENNSESVAKKSLAPVIN